MDTALTLGLTPDRMLTGPVTWFPPSRLRDIFYNVMSATICWIDGGDGSGSYLGLFMVVLLLLEARPRACLLKGLLLLLTFLDIKGIVVHALGVVCVFLRALGHDLIKPII